MGVVYNYLNITELDQLCFYAKCTRFIIIVLLPFIVVLLVVNTILVTTLFNGPSDSAKCPLGCRSTIFQECTLASDIGH